MGKIIGRVRRRADGSFQALVLDAAGGTVWRCDHPHNYGTSNRMKQDSASKCAHARVKEIRNEHAQKARPEAEEEAAQG